MQDSTNTCPQCGALIPTDAPGGLCPACVLLGAAATTDPGMAAAVGAPTIEEVRAAFPDLDVQDVIGHGGMGVVFKAYQKRLERLVALKILPPTLAQQPGFAERFSREARALARLSHPHIVAVYDVGEQAGFYYLLMEYVNGINLREAMRAGIKPEQALALVPAICEALQFAHDKGVLHRDIKPENILLDTAGTVKLADFGIAKVAGEAARHSGLTQTGAQLGTVAYMAPEQIERPGTVDHRADIYSLGVVFYEMLTGELPLGRFAAPSEKAQVSSGVDEVVLRALEKERDRRQQSATEMKTEVENLASNPGNPRVKPGEWQIRCTSCGRTKSLAEAGGIRIGAASIGKRTLVHCTGCGGLRFGAIEQAGANPPPVPSSRSASAGAVAGSRGQSGRTLAIVGAWLNIVPLILAILFIPLWFDLARLSSTRMKGEAVFFAMAPRIASFVIPSALALIAGFILTLIALVGCRYRARWFFWWVVIYGLAQIPSFVGLIPLIFCLVYYREFFPDRTPGSASTAGAGSDDDSAKVVI